MCSNRVDPLANPLLKTWSRWWKDKKGYLWYMSTFSMTESEVTEWWIRSDGLQQEPHTVQPPQKKATPSNEPSNVPWCGEAGTGGSVASGAYKVVPTAARMTRGDRSALAEGVNFLAYGTYTDCPARITADCRCGALPF